jgi:hypothetical protein
MTRLLTDKLTGSPLCMENCFALTVTMVCTYQGDELSTTFNEVRLDLFFVWMILERESWKGVDTLGPPEFGNNQLDRGLAKCFAIEIEISAVHTQALHF